MNQTFRQFALAFLGKVSDGQEIPFPGELNRSQLNGTIDSLGLVDSYLDYVREHLGEISVEDKGLLILRCGAYVGECIRMTWEGSYNWEDYDDYMPRHPQTQKMIPHRISATCAFLVRGDDSMIMPLNKVARSLFEGPENNVHYFASCERQHHQE